MSTDTFVYGLRAEDVHTNLGYGPEKTQCQLTLGDSLTLITHSEQRSRDESIRFLLELRAATTETIEHLRNSQPAATGDVCPFCHGNAEVAATTLLVEGATAQVVRCVCSDKSA